MNSGPIHPGTQHAPSYRADVDGLRALAVLAVVVFHAFPDALKGGFVGVDVFFVISGYLISQLILAGLADASFTLRDFYARRVRRIFPALLLVLATSYLVGWYVLLADQYEQLGKHIAGGAGFVSNLLLWKEAGYFDLPSETKPLLHLWSLGIEEQFYIFWPVLLLVAWRRTWNVVLLIVAIAVASFVVNLDDVARDPVAAFYSPVTRIWELLCGSLLAWLQARTGSQSRELADEGAHGGAAAVAAREPWRARWGSALSAFGLVLLIGGYSQLDRGVGFPGIWAAIPVAGTSLLILASPGSWINRRILASRVLVWLGLISFPLYLWHWPLLTFAKLLAIDPPGQELRLALVIAAVLLAWLTYAFIERPIRFGAARRRMTAPLVASMCVLGIAGAVTAASDGFAFRRVVVKVDSLYDAGARRSEAALLSRYRDYTGDRTAAARPVVVILGDSYATQWTPALLSHLDVERFDVASVKYLGCKVGIDVGAVGVHPIEKDYEDNCSFFSSFVSDRSLDGRISAVMLVSHRPFEYPDNAFRFGLIRWLKARNPGLEVFVFGNYFQLDKSRHPSCEKLMARARSDASACLGRATYPPAEPAIESLAMYPRDLELHYIDIIKLHCRYDRVGCAHEASGVPFISDWNHLNATFVDWLLSDIRTRRSQELGESGISKYFKQVQH